MHGHADKGGNGTGKRRPRRDADGMDAKMRSMEARQRTVTTQVCGLWLEPRSHR